MINSYYNKSLDEFLTESSDSILGQLTLRSSFDIVPEQRNAWVDQIIILKRELNGLKGHLHFEYQIPRIGKRIDNLLLFEDKIIVFEFKTGKGKDSNSGLYQAWDYCLDLKYFHEQSHNQTLVPICVSNLAGDAKNRCELKFSIHQDNVAEPLFISPNKIRHFLDSLSITNSFHIDPDKWNQSQYKPSPTIVEAARHLYNSHDVESITRTDADVENLTTTTSYLESIIETSKAKSLKSICFVTGVPGAGKTLVGLNLTVKSANENNDAIFLSGNAPLVDVLQESLARDQVEKAVKKRKIIRKEEAKQRVKAFVQNIHHFRDEYLKNPGIPTDKIVIFDEAQRAWNTERTYKFLTEKKKIPQGDEYRKSEPQILLNILNRHSDWCVVVCLIGGGQEIHSGEAGLDGWLDALEEHFQNWNVYISPSIFNSSEYSWKNRFFNQSKCNFTQSEKLHLAVSRRSFRSENLARFVSHLLNNEINDAREELKELTSYPIVITRSINKAKSWLKARQRGTERIGLLASSEGQRLRAEGIYVTGEPIKYVQWYLNDSSDIRSSDFLEVAATEFECQGLEIDWACVCWDLDLRRIEDSWQLWKLKGNKWNKVNDKSQALYMFNTYRVLLTRARQGMVIYVPSGDDNDSTREPSLYNSISNYFTSIGVEII